MEYSAVSCLSFSTCYNKRNKMWNHMIIGDSESLEKPKDLATGTVWLLSLLGKSDAWTMLHKIGSAVLIVVIKH